MNRREALKLRCLNLLAYWASVNSGRRIVGPKIFLEGVTLGTRAIEASEH